MTDQYVRNWGERKRSRGRGQDAPETAAQAARSSYYGLPVIHKAHWNWMIVVYFFLGGLSGACYVIASIAELIGARRYGEIVRAGRFLSFLTLLPCPVLLILDLQRPERFLHMLRVVKLRSPMSVGTWGLLLFSAFST
ncbi:MAG: NrfD/PsrC family molybdoenzyme membrane anchor subunit, partial [Thermomicrobiales bacterium]